MGEEYSNEQVEKIASMIITYAEFKLSKEGVIDELPFVTRGAYEMITPKMIRNKVEQLLKNPKRLEFLVGSEENIERAAEEMISK